MATKLNISSSFTAVKTEDGKDLLRVGVIGYGYWGPNIVRNFHAQDQARVVAVCDKSQKSLGKVRHAYPDMVTTDDVDDLLTSPDIDLIAVVTPVWTHYELAKKALQNGKHVFVEKPFTCSVAQGEELIELAERKGLKIMVDHTFLFTGAVRRMKQMIDDGTLGELYYYDSTRVNLGLFQHDVNVLWDLAPHDLSVMDHLIKQKPEAVVATGERHLNGVADIAFMTLYYPGNMIGHINVNWLSPVKVRTTLIGGEKKMLVWNDLEADEKLKVYDKGVQMTTGDAVHQLLVSYRTGDMWAPKIEQVEALRAEAAYFVDCILNNKTPFNDGHAGLHVVRMLEAADKSLQEKGKIISL
ncbi:MAG TPA: Gfo/Idh/MocA family oxidoreductase [Candidatus Acidoferrum sp.]|jgi:predicted dehydrogenase|nr:Gfo/Idh/MocA family oxidoreductase [Candidatus Acidoferrum sp.]